MPEEIRAGVRSAVKTVLRKKKIREEDFEPFLGSVMVQVRALYAEWHVGWGGPGELAYFSRFCIQTIQGLSTTAVPLKSNASGSL